MSSGDLVFTIPSSVHPLVIGIMYVEQDVEALFILKCSCVGQLTS